MAGEREDAPARRRCGAGQVDTGIRTDGVLVASVAGDIVAHSTREESIARHARGFRQMRDALGRLPGVHAVTAATRIPFLNAPEERPVHELYSRRRDTPETAYRGALRTSNAMPEYFATLGVPILDGRDFADTDTLETPPVAILSRRAGELLFQGEYPLGQQVRWGVDPYFWATVIPLRPRDVLDCPHRHLCGHPDRMCAASMARVARGPADRTA